MARWRTPLARHGVVWLLATVLLASGVGFAVSWAMGRVLGATVDLALGEAGRFDALVQVQQERRGEALAALGKMLRASFPGATYQGGPSAAGSSVLFVRLADGQRDGDTFEHLAQEIGKLPGVVGWVPLIEPSVVASRLHPSVSEALERHLATAAVRDDVRFTFHHGGELVVAVRSPADVDRVQREMAAELDRYRVVRVNPDGGVPFADPQGLAERAAKGVQASHPQVAVVRSGRAAAGEGAGIGQWLAEMQGFLLSYAPVARITLDSSAPALKAGDVVEVGTLRARVLPGTAAPQAVVLDDLTDVDPEELLDREHPVRRSGGAAVGTAIIDGGRIRIEAALSRTESLLLAIHEMGGDASDALEAAGSAALQLDQAITQLQGVVSQLDRAASGEDPVQGTIIALALSALLGPSRAGERVDASDSVATLRRSIESLEAQVANLRKAGIPQALESVRGLRDQLPSLQGQEVASALEALEQAPSASALQPEGFELVVRGPWPGDEGVVRTVKESLDGAKARVYTSPGGVASSSPRAMVLSMANRASRVGAVAAAEAALAWSLLNDWSAVSSLFRSLVRGRRRSRAGLARLWAAAAGAVTGAAGAAGVGCMLLRGQGVAWWAGLAGFAALAGWAAGWWSERLSPVDADAVEAARAAGFPPDGLLTHVVAPQTRPWVLAWVASRRPLAALRADLPTHPAGALGDAPTAPAPAGIEVAGVVKRFGDHMALDGVDLRVERGETVVVMGPSGCGKSTLLRCIKGLVEPDRGRVQVGGRVSLVFQRPQLIRHLPVLENVALAARAGGLEPDEAMERARLWLETLEMGPCAGKLPAQLSGGEGQRAAIARALVAEPDVVLWDEPTSQLDPVLVAEVLGVMKELIRRLRTTMLIVTHEPRFALRVAHRLVLMDAGRVVEDGEPHRVLTAPASTVGQRLAALAAI